MPQKAHPRVYSENPNKVFVIGLSRTGTVSITKALQILGYKSRHCFLRMIGYRDGALFLRPEMAKEYDALTDTPVARFYKDLDHLFPQSKFVLTIRNEEDWLESCQRHFFFLQKFINSGKPSKINRLHSDLYGAPQFDRERFRAAHRNHLAEVLHHFKGREDDLLVLNICGGEGWKKLCRFLDQPTPEKPFPRLNASRVRVAELPKKLCSFFRYFRIDDLLSRR